jgi:hypothetical protein
MPTTIDLRNAAPASGHPIPTRTAHGPDRPEITVDTVCLNRDGKPWLPVMGEIHYARVPETHWRRELLKMNAGGITLISTYIFWIHHEEIEGTFDWTGRRNLRGFVQTCGDLKLNMIVRGGPWCHGEVRNGGFPDWLLSEKTRTDDPTYLDHVRTWYAQIAKQLDGLLWKDNGPVMAMQIENEFGGAAEHLVTLKKLAIDAGLDVCFYTKTGWPQTKGAVPYGELLPLYGAYAEGFWDRELTSMPHTYWRGFTFESQRSSDDIGTDQLGHVKQQKETHDYPYLTCELGGGMEQSYHRRILIDPRDVLAIAITRIGSGSNLPGYYMYHGGTNPTGKLSTLQESQATKYYNDVPTLSYDFQAPLGQFGQVREHYHLLRLVHLFLADFGSLLTRCGSHLPAELPKSKTDTTTLRYAVRSDGKNAFVFINNYQRGEPQPAKQTVQFELDFTDGTNLLPAMTIPADTAFFLAAAWPAVGLRYAMAQPVCQSAGSIVFVEIPGITPEFALVDGTILHPTPGQKPFCDKPSMILLDMETALTAYKVKDHLTFAAAGVVVEDGDSILELDASPPKPAQLDFKLTQPAGAPRPIHMGRAKVAEAPSDADFAAAAVWKINLPENIPAGSLLRIHYQGDVARLYAGEVMLNDNFYNGRPFDLAMELVPANTKALELRILPLQKSAPIYFSHPPEFSGSDLLMEVESIELISRTDNKITS